MTGESGASEQGAPEAADEDMPFEWGPPRGHSAAQGVPVSAMAPPPPSITAKPETTTGSAEPDGDTSD